MKFAGILYGVCQGLLRSEMFGAVEYHLLMIDFRIAGFAWNGAFRKNKVM
jgi:hypothetical protein